MAQLFGEFINDFPPDQDFLQLTFTPSSRPIKQRWKNNRLSAHFVADYMANFIPVDEDDPTSEKRIKESKGAVSYVANELLENAIKFNDEKLKYKVRFGIHFIEKSDNVTAVMFATNSVQSADQDKLKAFIEELLSSDPNDMYINQIEKSAEEDTEASGLGLLTMINDYGAVLGWNINTIEGDPPVVTVTTMAQIKV